MRKRKAMIKIFLAILTTVFVGGIFLKKEEKEAPKGFVHRATKGDTVLYFVGHLWNSPKDIDTFTKSIKEVADISDVLLVEMDRVKDLTYTFINNVENALKPSNKTILEVLNEDELEDLKKVAKDIDMDYDIFVQTTIDNGINILGSYIKAYFTNPDESLDSLLTKYFYKVDKPVLEYEGYEAQQRLINNLIRQTKIGIETNEEFFREILKGFDEDAMKNGEKFFKGQDIAYQRGNISTFENDVKNLKKNDSETYNMAIVDRNKNSFERLQKLIKKGQTNLIATRVNQLLLEDGLLKMFEDDGYKIEYLK